MEREKVTQKNMYALASICRTNPDYIDVITHTHKIEELIISVARKGVFNISYYFPYSITPEAITSIYNDFKCRGFDVVGIEGEKGLIISWEEA